MKKLISLLLAASMLFTLAACGAKTAAPETAPQTAASWSLEGFFQDENGNIASVTRMDDVDEPGWYVGFMNGEDLVEDSYGGMLQEEGGALRGSLPCSGEKAPLTVTVSEEGEGGLLIVVEGGESYHFTPMEMAAPAATLWVNTEGYGSFTFAKEGEESSDTTWSSFQEGLEEPASYVLTAVPGEDWFFVKWTLNGEDYSTDEQITLTVSEDADLVAVFDFAGSDGQNPVMNFIGEYQCDRAHALVECLGDDAALITIEWGGSVSELARWTIVGPLDLDTLTITYSGCTKSVVTFNEKGEETNEELVYEDGTGTIVFGEDGSFTWHEDQSEYGTDMVFEWLPVGEG